MEPQSEIKIAKNDIWGRVFVNVVSLKYTGMIVYGPGPQKVGFHYQSRGKGSLCFLASLLCLEHKIM